MARLTRTQKYAELRERMAHDSETSISTSQLSEYENKLNQLDELFKQTAAPTKNVDVVENSDLDFLGLLNEANINPIPVPEKKVEVAPVEAAKEAEPVDTIEKIAQDKAEKVLSIEEMVEKMVSDVEDEIRKIAPIEAKPTNTLNVETAELIKEETPVVEEIKEEVIETTPVQEETAVEEPAEVNNEEPTEVKAEEPVEVVKKEEPINAPVYENEYAGIEARVNTIISIMDPSLKPEPIKEEEVKPVEVVAEGPIVIEEPVVEETKPEVTAELEEPEKVEIINNDFVNSTIEEVKNYNLEKGNETIDTLHETLIDQARHSEVVIPDESEDEDVANTISLELNNVLNSLNEESIKEEKVEVEDTKVIEKVEEVKPVEEHKAIAKELEKDDDVVEIKNITETLKITPQVDSNVLDDTIPFDIAGEEEIEDDDIPSKTLNIILGILIGVLVLVLLVIVYYILVARGIIG